MIESASLELIKFSQRLSLKKWNTWTKQTEVVLVLQDESKEVIYIKQAVEIKDKINLTIPEASTYSNIGETTIRKLLSEKACPFLLKVGNKHLVKRVEFEKYLAGKHFI